MQLLLGRSPLVDLLIRHLGTLESLVLSREVGDRSLSLITEHRLKWLFVAVGAPHLTS